jgi:hypothetical protein
MINLTLKRQPSIEQGTYGFIVVNGTIFDTIELPWCNNLPSYSCIPVGTYQCDYGFSDHLKRYTYWIKNVPGRTDTEIHNGNYAGDIRLKDANGNQLYQSNVQGCILIGLGKTKFRNEFGNMQNVVDNSVSALAEFEKMLNNESFLLTIVNDF